MGEFHNNKDIYSFNTGFYTSNCIYTCWLIVFVVFFIVLCVSNLSIVNSLLWHYNRGDYPYFTTHFEKLGWFYQWFRHNITFLRRFCGQLRVRMGFSAVGLGPNLYSEKSVTLESNFWAENWSFGRRSENVFFVSIWCWETVSRQIWPLTASTGNGRIFCSNKCNLSLFSVFCFWYTLFKN